MELTRRDALLSVAAMALPNILDDGVNWDQDVRGVQLLMADTRDEKFPGRPHYLIPSKILEEFAAKLKAEKTLCAVADSWMSYVNGQPIPDVQRRVLGHAGNFAFDGRWLTADIRFHEGKDAEKIRTRKQVACPSLFVTCNDEKVEVIRGLDELVMISFDDGPWSERRQ